MNLLNPAALIWAALAIPIVVFYILKIRMRRVPVSTVMFWEQVFEEKQPRSIWQKLRHLLSLLLQLLFLFLLVSALTDPFFDWEVRQQRRVILVVDNSASMQAANGEGTRFDTAVTQAQEIIDGLRVRDEMAILSAATQPQVVCGLTSHQRTLRDTLAELSATDGPTRVAETIDLARRLLADHENGQIVLLSDGCFAGAEELVGDRNVTWLSVGETTDNVAITRYQVRRSLLDPLGYEVLVEVQNFSDADIECRLELELAGEVVDVIPLTIEASGKWSDIFAKTSATGGRLRAFVTFEDELPADNEAWAVLPERRRQSVILVGERNLFLERVFEANSLVDLTVTDTLPETVTRNAVVVFHRNVPERLPDGNVVVLEPTEASDLWELSETLDDPIVADQDSDSDLLAYVRLDNVLMPEARRLTPKKEATILVEAASGDPLYFSIVESRRKLLVLSVNLERGDLPLRTAFPIMFSNALSWFEGSGGELRESLATGNLSTLELPNDLQARSDSAETPSLELVSPQGQVSLVTENDDSVTIGPLEQRGIWSLRRPVPSSAAQSSDPTAAEMPTLEIACNIADPEESDLRSAPELKETKTVTQAGFSRPIWFYLVLIAAVLTGIEWFLYQRRFIT
ncbi:MAG: vWA domain-containing protein [Planctomycetota bacterium]|jgi:hypothetical protein